MGLLEQYDFGDWFCELLGSDRLEQTGPIRAKLERLDVPGLRRRARDAERELNSLGITFTVYSESQAIDRILPFDVIPRILTREDWSTINLGAKQRVAALNHFLWDIYHDEKIIKDGVVPEDLIKTNPYYRSEMNGVDVPQGVYVHICGTDLVRDEAGTLRVLEDNARTPSGVSYVVENRHLMMRAFPDLVDGVSIEPVDEYGRQLMKSLREVAPLGIDDPNVVLLSPGVFNSAYFEHIFLAREMGAPLVQGSDLVVENDRVFLQTTAGLEPVHVIYRRIDDDFLDPKIFRKDSALGVPGLFEAYRKGNVTLANAVGTGVADDKAVYAYMPRIIRYYLDEDPILPNVETHICREADGLQYTLDNLDRLVVKPVGESGGYGVVIGPRATKKALRELKAKLLKDPTNFISQPVVGLSVCPTLAGRSVEPRHVDLRPFTLTGKSSWVLPGGLTRVALKKNSLIVNSSQGGGSKDTWVLA